MGFSNGDGTFSVTNEQHKDFPRWASERGPHTKLLTGDFNGDGRTDFALCGISDWREFPIAFSNGDGTVNVVSRPAGGISKWSGNMYAEVLTGDFNTDGYDDVAITGVPGWVTVPLVFSNGDGTFVDVNSQGSHLFTEMAALNNSKGRVVAGEFSGEGGIDLALVDQRRTNTITYGRYTGFASFYPYSGDMT